MGFDGAPLLESQAQYLDVSPTICGAEYHRLIRRTRHGHETLLDPYGTVREAEFFAVATESFFEQPLDMEIEHPKLYELFRNFFRQDPAERFRPGRAPLREHSKPHRKKPERRPRTPPG